MPHPSEFPLLPEVPNNFQWGANVLEAHNIITTAYNRADTLLRQEEADPVRLRVHSDQIANRIVPILEALEPEVGDQPWIAQCADTLGHLMVDLVRAATAADTMYGQLAKWYDILIFPTAKLRKSLLSIQYMLKEPGSAGDRARFLTLSGWQMRFLGTAKSLFRH
jgi:glutathione S-transferase